MAWKKDILIKKNSPLKPILQQAPSELQLMGYALYLSSFGDNLKFGNKLLHKALF